MYVFTLRYKLGVDFYANITPLPRGFNVRERERERESPYSLSLNARRTSLL